jgi:hypothetical protein
MVGTIGGRRRKSNLVRLQRANSSEWRTVKDFNDLCAVSYDDFENKRELWEVLP